ncbi:hypothetical protein A7U60_g4072 [Sanghuangporus baumii]|uniref:Uncharacterized protein n=1 Tax=Sanghuangporus baumii TaxID=108892 RepID=A0A9Q5HZB1_SANBA|nr:hypothetical protein A7U60_g4072 [Sanghuangporus baumii]
MPTKTKQIPPAPFFNDLSYLKQWSEIEATLASASARVDAGNDSEIGWIEGRVHETRSTQKEVEILLVQPLQSGDASDIADQKREAHEALRIFITCPELIRFVFALNQTIKISLEGARVIHELVPHGSGLLPFSLVFSSFLSIQSVRGGACVADGDVIDTRRGNDRNTENSLLESEISKLSIDETLLASLPAPRSSPKLGQNLALGDSTVVDASDDYTAYPPLMSLTEGMTTPLLGIVETVKPPSTTTTDDASSYEFRRGFRVTCFSQKSRLARELPSPSEGDVILLKSVKISRWSGILFGTVYHGKLDWISYKSKTDTVTVPQHAKSGSVDSFYGDLEGRREMFKQFVKAMESGPWNSNNRDVK